MAQAKVSRYFLGANTARGFYSLYEAFGSPHDMIWYIKGGPGNGKSTFMRTVAAAAEEEGLTVEYAFCSGDPASLDAIYIPERRIGYVDATSPHVQEPGLPGVTGRYLDLSAFYKKGIKLEPRAIADGFTAYRRHYSRAYELLGAAELADPARTPDLTVAGAMDALSQRAGDMTRSLPEHGAANSVRRLFLSAWTCEGRTFFRESLDRFKKVYWLHSDAGLADPFLREIDTLCRCRALATIQCLDPLSPERLEGVLIPEADTAFYRYLSGGKRKGSHIYLDKDLLTGDADVLSSYQRSAALYAHLLRQVADALAKAKRFHDALEAEYRPWVDFKALDRLTSRHIKEYI